MAEEITGVIQIRCVKDSFDSGQQQVSLALTQNVQGAASGTVTVATTNTQVPVTGLTTYGFLYMRNIDGTNFVTLGTTVGYEFKMKAGEPFFGRVTPGTAIWLKADTAACKVQYLFLND